MDPSQPAESFRSLLLRDRGRTGLGQRDLALRAGVSRRSVQDWEAGITLPSAERLQGLIRALLETGGLTSGREMSETRELWAAVEREGSRMHAPFDGEWFARVLSAHAQSTSMVIGAHLRAAEPDSGAVGRAQDWGEAPDAAAFVGRAEELALLQTSVLDERCRLVAVLGMGGIGKTSLAAKLAQSVAPSFERVFWRSLRNAPPVTEWLGGAIGFLSDQQLVPPDSQSDRITTLVRLLRSRRCLLVLDNAETLFEPRQREGHYRSGMEGYGLVLQSVGETTHQSCLLLTSRETPPELFVLGSAVRTLELHGLGITEARSLLADKQLNGDSQAWATLVDRYGGNGLALKIVSETIRQVYDGDIAAFLADAHALSGTVFGGIRRLLDAQMERLSSIEYAVLRRLAVEREPVNLRELLESMASSAAGNTVVEAIENLRRRSLVERGERAATFTLQSMVLEYVTDRLVETVAEEINCVVPVMLVEQPLIKAQSKDYVRQTQERLIGAPILQRLLARRDARDTEQLLVALLDGWRSQPVAAQGFGPANVINLLRLLRNDLRGMDFSRLVIRQAYLAQVEAQDVNLAYAHLTDTAVADAFDFPSAVAMSGDGALLAAGTSTGEVWLWRVNDRTPLLAVRLHSGTVWGVALSADGRLLASGGTDATVRVWETTTGRSVAILQGYGSGLAGVALSADGELLALGSPEGIVLVWETSTGGQLASLEGHTGGIRGVALSAEGHLLASGGTDGTVRLWDTRTPRPLATLRGHSGGVWGVALSAEGHLLASGGSDGTMRLWETDTCRLVATLHSQMGEVRGVALSADGRLLAAGSTNGTVRLWETGTGLPVATLQGHAGTVWDLALSADGHLLASGGGDGTVRLWETGSGRPLATLQGRTGGLWGVALSSQGDLLASGGEDGTVRLWETGSGAALACQQAHTGGVRDVALSPDGQLLVSGGEDGTVRLWETRTGRQAAALEGHLGGVWSVALSYDGRLLASGSEDGTVRLWQGGTGRPAGILHGHTGGVRHVALSADSALLASGGADATVRLWETQSGRLQATLLGHSGVVWCVALSADGRLLASGGTDRMVHLWATDSAGLLANLHGHSGPVWCVALSADGALAASGSADGTVRLWDTVKGRGLMTLQGHSGAVRGVALSPDAQQVVSSSFDGTVKLWDTNSGTCLRTLRAERRYERMDITGLTGITDARRAALLALGAVEQQGPRPAAV